jgi:tetratricopeptide (TPR) repeat protein
MTGLDAVRKFHLFLLVGLFIFCIPGISAQRPEEQFPAIVSALQNQQFDEALALILPALKAAPGNAQLWAMRGAAYRGKGNTKDALESFRHALKISPNYIPALEAAIQIEFEAGNPAAIPLLERVLRSRPNDLTSHAMLAVLEYQQKNCSAAVPHFEKAESLLESKSPAMHAYAVCLVKEKQYNRALKIFQHSLALNPDDEKERRLLASVELMAKEPNYALTTLQPLLQKSSPDIETLELASSAYEANKDTDRAVSTLRQAILLDPQNVNLYLDFANICYAHGSFKVGIDVINDGLALQPNAAPLYFARGVLYVQRSEYEKGEADFEKAYELDPTQSLSVAAQGLAAAQQHDITRALQTIKDSLAKKPNDPVLLYMLADILSTKNAGPDTDEFELALHSAQKAVELQPSLGVAHAVLGKLYLQAEQYKETASECRKALESDPNDQQSVYHLIQALRKTGNTADIPQLLKRFASLREQAQEKDKERSKYKLVD